MAVIVSGDQGSVFIDVFEEFGATNDTVAGTGGGGRPATGGVHSCSVNCCAFAC